jgi:hypothetical protein
MALPYEFRMSRGFLLQFCMGFMRAGICSLGLGRLGWFLGRVLVLFDICGFWGLSFG